MSGVPTIIYTKTDEAPALATHSFLPIVQAFTKHSGITVETRDISLAGRIISQFPDILADDQKIPDHLAELGALATKPEANIIKLPNISASVPQLKAAVAELRSQGYPLPDFPENPQTDAEKDIRARYAKVMGSAVNPVLREGNSDRRAPKAVKEHARKHPHTMGAWSAGSKTSVGTMAGKGDFFSNQKSVTVSDATDIRIEFVGADGTVKVLKESTPLQAGEILDCTFMSKASLLDFLATQIAKAKEDGVLFSLHMKATMMKVSDPIIFGRAVEVFFKELVANHAGALPKLNVDFKNGFGDLIANPLFPALRSAPTAVSGAARQKEIPSSSSSSRLLSSLLLTMFLPVAGSFAEPLVPEITEPPKTIAFMGDSITHAGSYHQVFQLFLATRYPGRDLWTTNHGHAGFTAGQMFSSRSFELDFAADPPDIAFVHFGMNDVRRSPEEYRRNLNRIIERLKEIGSQVILLSPTPYDDLHTGNPKAGQEPEWNGKLIAYMAIGREVAAKHDVPYIDLHSTLEKVNLEEQRKDPKFSLIGDRVHPNKDGHQIMAYDLIKGLNLRSSIYEVRMDAAGKVQGVEGAELKNFKKTETGVVFQLEETALPFPGVADAKGFHHVPFTKDLNTMTLAVTDLPAATYQLSIDDVPVGKFTREEFARGIDLSQREESPQYQTALALSAAILKTKTTDQNALADAMALRNNLIRPEVNEGQDIDWADLDPAVAFDAANRLYERLVAEDKKPTNWRSYVFNAGRKAFTDWNDIHERLAETRRMIGSGESSFTRRYELAIVK